MRQRANNCNNKNSARHHRLTPSSLTRSLLVSGILATVWGASWGVCASEYDDELTEEDFLQGMPLVMAATRLPQSVADTPVSMTVLDHELIRASGLLEIGDLFRLVPGFQVGLSWRDHHTATTYHGQSDGLSRRMQVLIDGRTAFTSQFGLTDWDRVGITIEDIERIEVVRGPAGSAYGSNAFSAAINIVTRDPVTAPSTELFSTVGSAASRQAGARYRYVGDKLEYTASANYLSSDGFDDGNNEVDVYSLRWQGRYQLAGHRLLDWQVGHADGLSGRGGRLERLDPVGDKEVQEQYLVGRLTTQQASDNEWYVQFSYNRTRQDDRNYAGTVADVLNFAGVPLSDLGAYPQLSASDATFAGPYDYHADRIDLEAQQLLTFNGHSRLVWGAGARQNRIKGFLVVSEDDYIEDRGGRLYGNWEYRRGDWLLNAGGMYESGDLADGNLSSRLGVNYRLASNHSLRVSWAQGWRQPFVGEAYHDLALKTASGESVERFIEVPQTPKPEKITTWELGYNGSWADGRLQSEWKLYRENIRNEIQETFDPFAPEVLSIFSGGVSGVINRTNGGETDIDGIEGNLDYRFSDSGRLWLSYAYSSVEQQLPVLAVRGFYGHSGTPRHTASVLLSQQLGGGWSASLGYYYLDEMAWFMWGGDTDAYGRLDLRLAKQWRLGNQDVEVELIGQSLNGSYSEFTPANQFDSRYFLRVRLSLD